MDKIQGKSEFGSLTAMLNISCVHLYPHCRVGGGEVDNLRGSLASQSSQYVSSVVSGRPFLTTKVRSHYDNMPKICTNSRQTKSQHVEADVGINTIPA